VVVAKALHEYVRESEDELSLQPGDMIRIVQQVRAGAGPSTPKPKPATPTQIGHPGQDDEMEGWWKGELHGETGWFPTNFVELIPSVAVMACAVARLGPVSPADISFATTACLGREPEPAPIEAAKAAPKPKVALAPPRASMSKPKAAAPPEPQHGV
jgi:hypothetical protein